MNKILLFLSNLCQLRSIRTKLNTAFFLVIFIPILIITCIFNYIYTNIIINQNIQNSILNLGLISQNIDLLTENMENYSRIIKTTKITQDFLRKEYSENDLQELTDISVLRGTFDNIVGRKNIVNSIFIFKLRKRKLYDIGNNASGISSECFGDNPFVKAISQGEMYSEWTDVHKSNFKIRNQVINTFTLNESILDMNSGINTGVISINLNEQALSSIYSNTKIGISDKYLIVNSQGKIMSASDPGIIYDDLLDEEYFNWCSSIKKGGVIGKVDGKKVLITAFSVTKLSWKVISIVPLEELLTSRDKVNMAVLIVGFMLFLITLLLSIFLSDKISKPILHLSKIMETSVDEGSFNIQIEKSSNDEVGILQTKFNKMMLRISELIIAVKKEQKLKREYELSAINSQVRPHFLYNALNSILGLLSMNDIVNAKKMVKALGEFYKLSLGNGKELIQISDELKLTESYIIIQKLKYGDKLTYEIMIPDEVKSCYIPKFSIQPLVENSFKHGFKDMKGRNMHIKIEGELKDRFIFLCVTDNGNGKDITQCFENSVSSKKFGLKSIQSRLVLYFGNKSLINIEAFVGSGTKVSIRIPMRGGLYDESSSG